MNKQMILTKEEKAKTKMEKCCNHKHPDNKTAFIWNVDKKQLECQYCGKVADEKYNKLGELLMNKIKNNKKNYTVIFVGVVLAMIAISILWARKMNDVEQLPEVGVQTKSMSMEKIYDTMLDTGLCDEKDSLVGAKEISLRGIAMSLEMMMETYIVKIDDNMESIDNTNTTVIYLTDYDSETDSFTISQDGIESEMKFDTLLELIHLSETDSVIKIKRE